VQISKLALEQRMIVAGDIAGAPRAPVPIRVAR
jgi:hypothetical protein